MVLMGYYVCGWGGNQLCYVLPDEKPIREKKNTSSQARTTHKDPEALGTKKKGFSTAIFNFRPRLRESVKMDPNSKN
jgi:hypothetical protein